jgi:hypothetical protein
MHALFFTVLPAAFSLLAGAVPLLVVQWWRVVM